MRFLVRNCLKYAQQCQNGIQLCGYHLDNMYTMEVWGNSLIPDAQKQGLRPLYSLNLKIGM